ncbi:right-handed parallel beta-helix repeat-containing protein [Agarivorans aestuarii]|uniref:right-handed parallel beta-helix repeat-containing protein n=1 Tax=Agarivorans aestuarii TaxID=1563703 RepID=UPI001C80C6FC|nr:right-handed parallel beta-helix repeat-containing protein [Agarivorans aestuarii]
MKSSVLGVLLLLFAFPSAGMIMPWNQLEMSSDSPSWANLEQSNGAIWVVNGSYAGGGGVGTYKAPFSTINDALKRARPGDEIWIEPGVYEEHVRIRKPRITLRSTELHQAKITQPINQKKKQQTIRIDHTASGTRLVGLDISGGYFYAVSMHVRWKGGWQDGVSKVVLSRNLIHGSGRDAIKINPYVWDVLIERNRIFNSGLRDSKNAEGIDAVNAHGITIQDNYFKDTATNSVYVKGGSSNIVIQRNLSENAGVAGILAGFDTSPQFFDKKRNPRMFEARDVRIENNIVIDSNGAGIGVYSGENIRVVNNTVLNAATSYHAPVYFGLSFQDKDPEAKRPPSRNVLIYNNVFSSIRTDDVVFEIRHLHHAELGPLSSLVGRVISDNNIYISEGDGIYFNDMRVGIQSKIGGLDEWRQHCECDFDSEVGLVDVEISSVKNIPLFSKPSNTEFSPEFDFYQNKRAAKTSVGAIDIQMVP